MGSTHTPVLLDEVAGSLIQPDYRLMVDTTIGGGGHTYRILSKYPNLRAVGMDIDEVALEHARERLVPFRDRATLKRGNFSELKRILGDEGISAVDAILFDLGVSSYQLEGERGFSFKDEQELDMRMDQRQEFTAYQVVNTYTYEELRKVIAEFGEEYKASQIARAIVNERKKAPIETARALGSLVGRTTRRKGKIHAATKTFQAIRMEVNHEIANLERGLAAAIDLLAPGGRVGVISFHSLEDRLVKTCFKTSPVLAVVTKKPIRPGRDELLNNPRARSAKLRIAEKVEREAP
jgi:16S rRNA (cytosine1402-N4)-methyltransferase